MAIDPTPYPANADKRYPWAKPCGNCRSSGSGCYSRLNSIYKGNCARCYARKEKCDVHDVNAQSDSDVEIEDPGPNSQRGESGRSELMSEGFGPGPTLTSCIGQVRRKVRRVLVLLLLLLLDRRRLRPFGPAWPTAVRLFGRPSPLLMVATFRSTRVFLSSKASASPLLLRSRSGSETTAVRLVGISCCPRKSPVDTRRPKKGLMKRSGSWPMVFGLLPVTRQTPKDAEERSDGSSMLCTWQTREKMCWR